MSHDKIKHDVKHGAMLPFCYELHFYYIFAQLTSNLS